MNIKKRSNIFDYATSELSQDAFLAWYCCWADESITNDKDSASINIQQIRERLRPYEEAVRSYAEMMDCD